MRSFVWLAVVVVVVSCRSSPDLPAPTPSVTNPNDDWFCQMAEKSDEWECIRDSELARDARPTRVPEPPPPPVPEEDAVPPARPTADPPELTSAADDPASRSDQPLYKQLAFQPDKPTRLLDLPSSFYAVQLVALSSKEVLDAYAAQERLRGMSAARVENDGRLYYVLLLGIYPDRQSAQTAADNMPAALSDMNPWVRDLGSLQQAMSRADALAGTSEI